MRGSLELDPHLEQDGQGTGYLLLYRGLRANGQRVGMWRDQVGKFFKDGHSSRLIFWKTPTGQELAATRKPVRA